MTHIQYPDYDFGLLWDQIKGYIALGFATVIILGYLVKNRFK